MNTGFMGFSRLLRTIFMLGMLFLALSYTSIGNAAQGCGQGFHQAINGRCVLNFPGPHATPARYHPGCWRNGFGQLRCYQR